MRLANQEIVKVRECKGYYLEMEVVHNEKEGWYQATYYEAADQIIWGEASDTHEGAVKNLDDLVDKLALRYPTLWGETK